MHFTLDGALLELQLKRPLTGVTAIVAYSQLSTYGDNQYSNHFFHNFSLLITRLWLSVLQIQKLDLIAVRIFDKRQHGGAVFHRARLAHDGAASGTNIITGAVNILDTNRNVAITGA